MAWAPSYITGDELKEFIRVESGDTVDDALCELYAAAASRSIDAHCNRQFGLVAAPVAYVARAWADRARGVWVADVPDLMTTVGFTVEVADGTVATYALEPGDAALRGRPWTRVVIDPATAEYVPAADDVRVTATGRWGWTAVPEAVTLAARLQGSRFSVRRDSPFGVAGSPTDGTELRLLSKLDPDVAVALRGLVRTRRVG